MAKKKKQNKKHAPQGSVFSDSMDYTDPRRLEQMIRRYFSDSVGKLRTMEERKPGLVTAMDLDSHRSKRRSQAAITYAPRIRELAQDVCPDIPDVFSIEEEWAYVNSLPVASYDMQEEGMSLTLGAAIWMLDRIKENGKIRDALQLLPKGEEILEAVYTPDIYDPVHGTDVIRSTLYVIQNRNGDCLRPGQKKKSRSSDPLDRVLADSFTTQRQQHQDVPSRQCFESLLSLIPPQAIEQAARRYEEKLFEWMERYYRCRGVYCEKQRVLEQRRKRFAADMENRIKEIQERENKLADFPLPEIKDPVAHLALSQGPTRQNSLEIVNSEPFRLIQYFEEKTNALEQELEQLNKEIGTFVFHSHRFGTMPYERLKRDFGEEIADVISEFELSDPYEMCFALLYLMDSGSDLPWLYYPGIVLSEYAGAMLPWFGEEYDETDDPHWEEYYGTEPPAGGPAAKNAPERADWYRMDYIYHNSDLDFQFRNNLAQIVYEVTGGIPPRNLHRYDDAIKHLRRYGITGKKMQIPLLYCMTLLGEGRAQSQDWRFRSGVPDELLDGLMDTMKAGIGEIAENQSSAEELQARIAALKGEVEQLKRAAYEAERENRELVKKNDALLQKGRAERQELAELREIVFLRENNTEPEIEAELDAVTFPYTVTRSTVIFGGHDTWAKAIRPMLAGDVRFVDRGMRPDADLIRHAEMVWIQPNSLSHADYYKIIRIIRNHNIPLHYFQFASAEKCAMQLVSVDRG